ncbi:MAG: lipase maturation factor family protein [Candidatus Binatia bacterium]
MGVTPPRPRVRTAHAILRGIAVVYAIAFVSLAVQMDGLYGSGGILPAAGYLEWLGSRLGEKAWSVHPTLFWFGASDAALAGACWAGAASAALLFVGIVPTLSAAVCWALYFSLFQVGRVFLGFQWDILLLEAGFLAIFLAPLRLRQHVEYDPEPPRVVIWMLRWLLFRLMFASGVVKLLSDDPAWWNLTALEYHYWTQPLPTWAGWFVHQLPALFHRFCVLAMFVIELGAAWFIFGTRGMRLMAFFALVSLQVLIAATGNYTFFNLLTLVLCLSLLDDDAFHAVMAKVRPDRVRFALWPEEEVRWRRTRAAGLALSIAAALPLAIAGGALMVARFAGMAALPRPVVTLVETLEPWHLTSSYGLFSVMTTSRREIVLEGSMDGNEWREYEMRWKPGDVMRAPLFVAPHQPRLDWQMWFAALGDWRRSPWLVEVERRLLDGSPAVLSLFAADPFDGRPPRHVRAMLYDYEFTDLAEWQETGAWWKRRLIGPFSPPLSR